MSLILVTGNHTAAQDVPQPSADVVTAPVVEGQPVAFVTEGSDAGNVLPWGAIQYTTGPGYGYRDGFSTLLGFIPILQSDVGILFGDLRGTLNNDALLSSNVGAGYRYYNPDRDRIWGANVFWDYRNGDHHDFNQVGFGFESLGQFWDARCNVYLVAGRDRAETFTFFDNPVFVQHFIQLDRVSVGESAMSGFDAEVGIPLSCAWGLKAYIGTYNFQAPGSSQAWGVKTRLEERLTDNLSLNLSYANDQVFGNSVIFQAAWRFGGGRAKRGSSHCDTYARRADHIDRNEQIVVTDQPQVSHELAIDPATGKPVFVEHVRNNAPAGGDGTFEHPLNTLAPAAPLGGPRAIILVYKGDGTSTGMDTGIVLQNGQRLLGDSRSYTFASQAGVLLLPNKQTGMPTITNDGPPAVTLANGNEVAGLRIGDTTTGVLPFFSISSPGSVNSANIHDNIITAQSVAISMDNGATGNWIIANNTLSGSGWGISGTLFGGSLVATITGNTINNPAGAATGIEFHIENDAQATFHIVGNSILATGNGIEISSQQTTVTNATIVNNTITAGANLNDIELFSIDTAVLTAAVTGNTLNGSGATSNGLLAESFNASTLNLALHGNKSVGNNKGYDLLQFNTSTFNLERDADGTFPPTSSNTGTFTFFGTINNVPFGSYQP